MKREGWTPAYIEAKIDEYLADLPTRDEYIYKTERTGIIKKVISIRPRLTDQTEHMEKLRAAVNEFDRFQHTDAQQGPL